VEAKPYVIENPEQCVDMDDVYGREAIGVEALEGIVIVIVIVIDICEEVVAT
jgi:hypothetical protein